MLCLRFILLFIRLRLGVLFGLWGVILWLEGSFLADSRGKLRWCTINHLSMKVLQPSLKVPFKDSLRLFPSRLGANLQGQPCCTRRSFGL